MPQVFDVVFRDALVFDGTGAPGIRGDVGITGDRIASVAGPGALAGRDAAAVVDGRGLALAPGFIDVHTHDDFAVVIHPEMAFKALGGVTTCVVGNCGMGAAPYGPASAMARLFHPEGLPASWEGYAGYRARLEAEPASVNVGFLVGHGSVRAAAMGGTKRAPETDELEAMRALLREGLEAGALGYSSGLIYEPGRHAVTAELVALARELAPFGGLYATHMRDESTRLLDSVRETIEIGERAGVSVQISHHKASGRDAWGLVRESILLIDEARARGVDVHADQYPYTAGSTILSAVLNAGAIAGHDGGGLGRMTGDDVVVASGPKRPEREGRSIAAIARELGLSDLEAAQRIAEDDPATTIIAHMMCEEDVQTVMRHGVTMIGSDGIPTLGRKPHPRLWGTFARVLGRYVRELGVLTLEEGVHRMTGLSAAKFGLHDRGAIREGAAADLVLFDPATVGERGSFENPEVPPAGIVHVLVNGGFVVRDGVHTGARPGRVLRRSSAAV
jgi:N-acyl-D-aspartate/D-glutamate deacylase